MYISLSHDLRVKNILSWCPEYIFLLYDKCYNIVIVEDFKVGQKNIRPALHNVIDLCVISITTEKY